jgi:hypothetical protein
MTVSDACPVQFWSAVADTFNEQEVAGIHQVCWQQPWACDEELVIQAKANSDPDQYFLTIYNSDGAVIDEADFESLGDNYLQAAFIPDSMGICEETIQLKITRASANIYDYQFETDLDGWANNGAGELWVYDSAFGGSARVSLGAGLTSRNLRITGLNLSATIHRIYFYIYVSQIGDSISFTARTRDSGATILDASTFLTGISAVGYYFGYLEVSAANAPNVDMIDLFVGDTSIGNEPIIYVTQIRVVDMSDDTREVILKSDSINVKEFHDATKLLTYTNQQNFAGVKYSNVSPDQEFYIRVPMRFFHERFPETDEAMELTNSVITTSSQMKEQKLAEIAHAPYYFHRKVQLILKHQSVKIDSSYWKKEEGYEIIEGRKNWPLKAATCWLTRENSVVRNII